MFLNKKASDLDHLLFCYFIELFNVLIFSSREAFFENTLDEPATKMLAPASFITHSQVALPASAHQSLLGTYCSPGSQGQGLLACWKTTDEFQRGRTGAWQLVQVTECELERD